MIMTIMVNLFTTMKIMTTPIKVTTIITLMKVGILTTRMKMVIIIIPMLKVTTTGTTMMATSIIM